MKRAEEAAMSETIVQAFRHTLGAQYAAGHLHEREKPVVKDRSTERLLHRKENPENDSLD